MIKRWPIIRHIRFYYLRYRVFRYAAMWGSMGIGVGGPNPSDLEHLDRIWRGEA